MSNNADLRDALLDFGIGPAPAVTAWEPEPGAVGAFSYVETITAWKQERDERPEVKALADSADVEGSSYREYVARLLEEAGLDKKAARWRECHKPADARYWRCENWHTQYRPHSCGVLGCKFCSRFQSAAVREPYEDALYALWLKRERGEWSGRFWFVTMTYGIEDGERIEDVIDRVGGASRDLYKRMIAEFGNDAKQCGYVASLEVGTQGVKREGRYTQAHVHMLIALDGDAQLSRWQYIVKREHGINLIVRADYSYSGEWAKWWLEDNWSELVGRDAPVSRVYEVAPVGLPFELHREVVEDVLIRLGYEGADLKKAVRNNLNATMGQTVMELLKYLVKAVGLPPAALAELIVAFDGKRRVWSGGLFYAMKREGGLLDWLKKNHPESMRAGRCLCKKCGGEMKRVESSSLTLAVKVETIREYLEGRSWLDTVDKSRGPKRLVAYYWALVRAMGSQSAAGPSGAGPPGAAAGVEAG